VNIARTATVTKVIMYNDRAAGLVQRFQFSTRDEAETEDFIRRMYIGNRSQFLSAEKDTSFTAELSATGGLAVSHLRATVNFRAFTEPFDYFLFLTVTNGHLRISSGRDEVTLRAGDQSFYPLGVPLEVELLDMGVRTLRLPAERLEAVAEHSAGIRAADFRFESTKPISPLMAHQWSALVDLAATVLQAESSGPAPLLAEELTRTAAITALHTFPNTALTIGYQPRTGWVAPAAVRRAAAFIRAHADQPIGMDQIAAAAGVGGRALRHAFRRHFGATPIGYLRRTRLELADQELRAAGPAGTITVDGVARRWGWAEPSRFAADYRRRFGTPPIHTSHP
jgi:AraC-like DNA-binding protein